MSHDAATGYIRQGDLSKTGLAWPYAKNQVGTAFQQLSDGARALDLRPKLLLNSTIVFQHGAVTIPVSLEQLLQDVLRWCAQNQDELVLLLPNNFAYESYQSQRRYFRTYDDDNVDREYTSNNYHVNNDNQRNSFSDDQYKDGKLPMVAAMSKIYNELGVTHLHCRDVYGMTVGDATKMGRLPTGGALLAIDAQDYYGSFCGKSNWVESQIVTCWSNHQVESTASGDATSSPVNCRTSSLPRQRLREYILASANNPATDDSNTLGPPANIYEYPFNEIQALWQVDTKSAIIGLAHLSSILEDNRQSKINQYLVDMLYHDEFNRISLFAVDNVALNGNALLSVLRNRCGQSEHSACGAMIRPPPITFIHLSVRHLPKILLSMYFLWLIIFILSKTRPRLYNTWRARLLGRTVGTASDDIQSSTWKPDEGLL